MDETIQFIRTKWEHRQGPPVLSTVDENGMPNSVYFTIGDFFDNRTFFIADNYFSKTRTNISRGTCATVLFHTGERTSYQIKGPICFHTSGPVFEAMRFINPSVHPGRAAAVIQIESIYCGASRLL